MHIVTHEVALGRGEYFRVLLLRFLKRRWLLCTFLVAMAVHLTVWRGVTLPTLFFVGCTILYPIVNIAHLWRFVCNRENKLAYVPVHYEFDDNFLNVYLADGTHSAINLENVLRARKMAGTYQLDISSIQFAWIPFRAFKSEDDMAEFERSLRTRHLL